MNITVAKASGFCPGVKRAVDTAHDLASQSERPVYMYGELVHNPHVIDELTAQGVKIAHRVEDITEPATVLVRAHGITPAEMNDLLAAGHDVVDRTCPFVSQIHRIVEEANRNGERVIITGSKTHPEVVGVLGHDGGQAIVLDSLETAETTDFPEGKYVLVSQTTFSKKTFDEICKMLKIKIAMLRIFDTICVTTASRQDEAKHLATNSDVMFVLGSQASSNTQKLVDVCKERCAETYLVEQPDEIRPILSGLDLRSLNIGITAGASTPERMIGEVIRIMTEQEGLTNQKEPNNEFDFEEFVDSIPQLKKGTVVKGNIIRYDSDFVYVDVKDKSEGRIPLSEFGSDFDLEAAANDHSEVEVYVRNIRNTDQGKEITLSKSRVDYTKDKDFVEKAYQEKTPITVRVKHVVKDGLIAAYGHIDIYVHRTQVEAQPVKELDPYLGQTFDILVTQFEPDRRRLRVAGSRRSLLQKERRRRANEIWASMEVGEEYEGTVRNLTDFGAFVDLGGVDGLVHISELSWGRIKHPSEVVQVGDKIPVFVREFDPERKRVSLGYRRAEMDPYKDVEERFPVGSIVRGIIVRIFAFGAFIEIAPGVDALCHISQISDYRLTKPNEVLEVGMEVDARVLEVSNEARRISVSIRDVEPINPVREDPPERPRRGGRGGGEFYDLPTSYSDTKTGSSLGDIATFTSFDNEPVEEEVEEPVEEVEETVEEPAEDRALISDESPRTLVEQPSLEPEAIEEDVVTEEEVLAEVEEAIEAEPTQAEEVVDEAVEEAVQDIESEVEAKEAEDDAKEEDADA
ncbi:MAG TPA: bifunctional 4-hydroxy-3-methylbut-2-enyl diphosphate reductase/30S ribosomal protein S1 [Fastidiosipila sp.]|nr:bifunctional 4-hydroxy-3-methylbut-2-enyl diphosphate reductase/30S ribosomal protein S1 [Fastidiosipila sp.]